MKRLLIVVLSITATTMTHTMPHASKFVRHGKDFCLKRKPQLVDAALRAYFNGVRFAASRDDLHEKDFFVGGKHKSAQQKYRQHTLAHTKGLPRKP